jgi:hypothetical protein
MNKLFFSSAKRFTAIFLSLSIVSLVLTRVPQMGLEPFGVIGIIIIISSLLYLGYFSIKVRFGGLLRFLDRYALWVLAAWIVVFLAWCGLVLFSDPYRFELNHGDAVFYSQTLWNLVNGLNPENSFYTFNGLPLTANDDPRHAQTYGYVSIFTVHQYWLPMAVLTSLYAFFSEPPMHVFALQICIVAFGVPGVFWAVRQAGGSRSFAVLAAIGYSLLPQIDTQLFFKGYFDTLALGIMPWLFGALLGKRWLLTCFFALLVALISYPHTYFVIIFGLAVVLFFRAFLPGAVVMLIGWGMLKLDTAVTLTAVSPYHNSLSELPSFFQSYVVNCKVDEVIHNIIVNSSYIISLLQGLAFLPLLALRRNGRWDMAMLGLWFVLAGAFGIMLFRSAGWEFPRNSFLIVPLFMMTMMACINLQQEFNTIPEGEDLRYRAAPSALLVISMTALIVFGVRYNSTPLASHLPWGEGGYFMHSREGVRDWDTALAKLDAIVPKDASIAWRAGSEVHALLTNRQHSWHMGREPKEVKYYVFLGDPVNSKEKQDWESKIANLSQRQSFKLLYKDTPGKQLIVFENLEAQPVPRNEKLLGWNVLGGVFADQQKLIGTAIRK